MNPKLDAILELASRYQYNERHAHQVECLVGTLFLEMEELHNLPREDRKLLEYAAILHDIGWYVSGRGHHRHTLMMILQEPLPAFSRNEVTIIANVARYHRKALPTVDHTAYGILSEPDRQRVRQLAALLRIADALDRSHKELIKELSCQILDDRVIIRVVAEEELPVELAAVSRKAELFRQVFQRDPVIELQKPKQSAEEGVLETVG